MCPLTQMAVIPIPVFHLFFINYLLFPFFYSVESATEFPSVLYRVSQRRPRYDSAFPYEFRAVRFQSAAVMHIIHI